MHPQIKRFFGSALIVVALTVPTFAGEQIGGKAAQGFSFSYLIAQIASVIGY